MFLSSVLPDLLFRHVTPSRWSTPLRLTTSECVSTLMLGVCSIRRMRYFDIVSVRPGPLTSMYTCLVLWAKKTAAWPAEFPPANHDDFLTATQLRLNESCAVINAGS